jgi:hypothetical protein
MKTDFCGEPVSAVFLLYLNLILSLFGGDVRIRQALLKAVRTVNCVLGTKKQGNPQKNLRLGKKERKKAFLRKKGKLETEPSIVKKRKLRKQKLIEKKKRIDKENKTKRVLNHQAVLVEKIRKLEQQLGEKQNSLKSFVAKPCMSCICQSLKFSPSVYNDKHFVEPNAYCFRKGGVSLKVSCELTSLSVMIEGYYPVRVGYRKFMKFLWQYSVVPCWNVLDKNIHAVVLANFQKLDKMWNESSPVKYQAFEVGTAEAKKASQRSVGIISSCYPYVVANLYSSVGSVGLTAVRGESKVQFTPKNVPVTTGNTADILQVVEEVTGTIPLPQETLGVPIKEVKPKSTTALAKPVLSQALPEKEERPKALVETSAVERMQLQAKFKEFSMTLQKVLPQKEPEHKSEPVPEVLVSLSKEVKCEEVTLPKDNRDWKNCTSFTGVHPAPTERRHQRVGTPCWICGKIL